LLIGTNNLGAEKPEQIADGIKAIVADYRQRCPDAVILLQGIFPRSHLPTDGQRGLIKQINEIIAHLADGKQVIFIDFGEKLLQPDGTLSADVMPDFLHPSAKGYQIWADAIQSQLDAVFHPAGN
jgi:lysophospholipase L1-like esterase